MKKRFLLVLATLICLLTLVLVIPASAEEEATATVMGHNLALEDAVDIIYYVDFQNVPDGAETGVLVWKNPQESYVYGTEDATLSTIGQDYGYATFLFPGISSKMMTQDIYAKAYVKDGDEITYGKLDKYSVLQYAYNMKGNDTVLPGGTATLDELLTDMLNYGATAQKHFNYMTDRLANATYYQISVVNGTLPDTTTKGLYQEGESVSLTTTVENFDHWGNEAGESVGSENPIVITVGDRAETYTAIECSLGLAFTSNGDGTCYVSGIGTCTDTSIVIPPVSPEGDTVVAIGNGEMINSRYTGFHKCKTITSVVIPNSVTSIGDGAFFICSSLTRVTFGENSQLESIGRSAFSDCTSLTSIEIPNSVTSIEEYAFSSCESLTRVTFGENSQFTSIVRAYAFSGCTSLTSIEIPSNVTSIGERVLAGCSSLESITSTSLYYPAIQNCLIEASTGTLIAGCKNSLIPDDGSVTSIGEGAFSGCSLLTSIEIPDSVTSIGGGAFSHCSSLTIIEIPTSVTSIGEGAFFNCFSLASVTFDENSQLTSIGQHAFYNCSSLTSITIGNGVTSIGQYAFYNCSSLTSVTFDENSQLTSIGQYAFSGCSSLTSITIGNGVTNIGQYAFSVCKSLTSVTFGENSQLTFIGSSVFYCCSSLTSIEIPTSVTFIGSNAFWDCSSLTSITIPASVTSIGNDAFYHCSSLTIVTFGKNSQLTVICNNAFYHCSSLTSIEIPVSVTSIGNSAFDGCSSLRRVINHSNLNLTIGSSDNGYVANYAKILIDKNGNTTYRNDGYEYTVTEDEFLFRKKNDTYALIAYLGSEETVTLPLNVEENEYSIYSMDGVRKVIIPDGIMSIGEYAFESCDSLASVTIGNGVTSIGKKAFSGCSSLTSIEIPDSVLSIGSYAFSGCSNLTSITYTGTMEQWNAISKGNKWNYDTGSYTIHCTDGDLSKQ